MRDWPRVFIYQLVKVGGLVIAGREAISGNPDPVVLILAVGMMVGAQSIETLDNNLFDPILKDKVNTPRIDSLNLSTRPASHLENVYKKHGIYEIPDPDVHMSISEPFADILQFEMDIAAAIILDGKGNRSVNRIALAHDDLPKAKTTPVLLQPGEQVLNRQSEIPIRDTGFTTYGHRCTPGCICSTPSTYNHIVAVVFNNMDHVACIMCGRILHIKYDAFDERVRSRAEKIERRTEESRHPRQEMFMVDQCSEAIQHNPRTTRFD